MNKPMPNYKLTLLILAAATLSIGFSIAAPSFADRTGATPRNTEGCQPAETKQVPALAIYNNLEGVALMISSPNYTEHDQPYVDILNREKIREVFRESITKNVLPYVKPSGPDCSIPPRIYDVDTTSTKKWEESVKIIDNPNILTIRVKVSTVYLDYNTDRPILAFVFILHRPGFKAFALPIAVNVFDRNKSPDELSNILDRYRDSGYFITR